MDQMKISKAAAGGAKTASPLRLVARVVVFLLIAAGLFVYANFAIGLSPSTHARMMFASFYDESEDSVDMVYVGSSAACRFFVSPLAYQETGMSSFVLGAASMPSFLLDNVAQEAERTQSPDLYVVELRSFRRDAAQFSESHCRRIFDSVSLASPERLDMITESLAYMEESLDEGEYDDSVASYLFPVVSYHDRLADGSMTASELLLKRPRNRTKGYQMGADTYKTSPQPAPEFSDQIDALSDFQVTELQKVMDSYQKLDAQVLYVLAPRVGTAEKCGITNALAAYVEEHGGTCLNLNTAEGFSQIGLDPKTDFYDEDHVNYRGAEKYTRYLCSYIKENYDLADHRGESGYESWDEAYQAYQGNIEKAAASKSKKEVQDQEEEVID